MLSAIALGRVAFGLLLLLSFSVGLAVVLMAVGAAVLYSKKLIGRSTRIHDSPAFHWLPLASAAAVIVVGLIMTGVSAGVLRPSWLV
jgi:ABC-type nickel/cobalt efflux system permease component RcnA